MQLLPAVFRGNVFFFSYLDQTKSLEARGGRSQVFFCNIKVIYIVWYMGQLK